MLNRVEHEKSFIISGPGDRLVYMPNGRLRVRMFSRTRPYAYPNPVIPLHLHLHRELYRCFTLPPFPSTNPPLGPTLLPPLSIHRAPVPRIPGANPNRYM